MMFSKSRATHIPSMQQNQSNNWINAFSMNRMMLSKKSFPQQKNVKTITEIPPDPPKKKMKWGEPVWFFFHTMAEKVKPESFQTIRLSFLKIVSNICRNLPCPNCAQHATSYIENTNLNTIQTKEELIEYFYVFHNEVNKRKGVQLFPKELLREKYSKANTINIINNFLFHFLDKSFSIRMIADDFHRKRLVDEIKQWLNSNYQYFEL